MKLYLIRHGRSEANLQRIFSGQNLNIDLTEQGEQEARAAGELLRGISFDKVYSSDQRRAWRTQEIALPEYKAERLTMIREYDVGTLTGLPIDASDQEIDRHRIAHDFTPYGGENNEMVRARAERFLSLITSLPYENVAAFSHVGFMKGLLDAATGVTHDPSLFACSNCGICVFEYKEGKWQVLHWNVAPFKKIGIAEA